MTQFATPPRQPEAEKVELCIDQELSLEQRMVNGLEKIGARIDMLEADNTMCLHALHALAKVLKAGDVERELAEYIHERGVLIRKLREAMSSGGPEEDTSPGLDG